MVGCGENAHGRHQIYDVGTSVMMALKEFRMKDRVSRFATLIHDIGKPATFKKLETGTITFYNHEVVGAMIARRIAERLRFSKKDEDKLVTLVRWRQFTVNEAQTDSAIRRFIKHVGHDYVG